MHIVKLYFALVTLTMMSLALQVMADEVRSGAVIPATKPSGLPKNTPVGDFDAPRPNRFEMNQSKYGEKVVGKLMQKKSNSLRVRSHKNVPVGDFGTSRTYPAANNTNVPNGKLKKQ